MFLEFVGGNTVH